MMRTAPPKRKHRPAGKLGAAPFAAKLTKNFSSECNSTSRRTQSGIDFDAIHRAALPLLPALLGRWLPGGRIEGAEYVALNPRRVDRRAGRFKVNLRTGRWADFATGDRGGDVISLAAYLGNRPQGEAARQLARMLGVEVEQ